MFTKIIPPSNEEKKQLELSSSKNDSIMWSERDFDIDDQSFCKPPPQELQPLSDHPFSVDAAVDQAYHQEMVQGNYLRETIPIGSTASIVSRTILDHSMSMKS